MTESEAVRHIAGYCVVNDVSEREFQLERHGTWDKGKGCDTFGPIGPWLVTADEVGDPGDLAMWLEVNGRRFQDGSTATMVYERGIPGQLREPVHDPLPRRRDFDGHSAGRRNGPEAARST